LLRRAQQAHPDDFWINFDLASSLMDACQPNEAVRFYSAALAIRPRSELALHALGDALRASRRPDEAAASPPPRRPLPAPGRQGLSRRKAKDY
jgi:serine/threonine-protein kinase